MTKSTMGSDPKQGGTESKLTAQSVHFATVDFQQDFSSFRHLSLTPRFAMNKLTMPGHDFASIASHGNAILLGKPLGVTWGEMPMTVDQRYYEVATPGSLSERLMIRARDDMYSDFIRTCSPKASDTILDIGVSDVLNEGANLLERLYPHRSQITACGLGEATEFQRNFPEVNYRQIQAGAPLPFSDKCFDIATSNAVLEHVGGVEKQRQFVAELTRVSRRAFLTVPHRYFPVEHHTGIPLAHWTDHTFRLACAITGQKKWTREAELRLMTKSRLSSVVPRGLSYFIGRTGLPLGPFSSNLYLVIG